MRQALEMALEALEDSEDQLAKPYSTDVRRAITAIKEALAQPEQEPVAWKETDEVECPVCKDKGFPWPKCGHITYLEPTPPQRTWVGLTDEERKDIELGIEVFAMSVEDILKETEAKLKEKNT